MKTALHCFCFLSLAWALGCGGAPHRQARTLLEQGDFPGAAQAAGTDPRALELVSVELLAGALADEQAGRWAVRALKRHGSIAEAPLWRQAGSNDPLAAVRALSVLSALGHEQASQSLERYLQSESSLPRAAAVAAWGAHGQPDQPFFDRALADSSEHVRAAAIDAMDQGNRRGAEAAPALVSVMRSDPSPMVRARALRFFSTLHVPATLVADAAIEGLTDEALSVRLAAIDVLSRTTDADAVLPSLEEVARGHVSVETIRAAAALARHGRNQRLTALGELLAAADEQVAATYAVAAAQIDGADLAALQAMLQRPEPVVRLQAAASLVRNESTREQASQALGALLTEQGWVGLQAALALLRAHLDVTRAEGRVLQALAHSDPTLRGYAVSSCTALPDGLALAAPVLGDADPHVRVRAAACVLTLLSR